MDEMPSSPDAAIIAPNRIGAAGALRLASEMLSAARERLGARDYAGSIEESRNAIRMASSALLMQEGLVMGTLEATAAYISHHYPGAFPLQEWVALENMASETAPGLYSMILEAMGKVKKTDEQDAREAIRVAESFVSSAESELGL